MTTQHPAAKRARQHAANISRILDSALRRQDHLITMNGELTPRQHSAITDVHAAHAFAHRTDCAIQDLASYGKDVNERGLNMLTEHLASLNARALIGLETLRED